MSEHKQNGLAPELGDFTATRHIIPIAVLAVGVGALGAVVALALLKLIGLCTNLFFYGRWSAALSSPAGNHLGLLVIGIPVVGTLIIGLMARFGSERIRGHGIPEALEAILIRGSRIEPRVALLKPISSAISIGSGGPFGAEGPIIMTGGAFGSMIAQLFHLTAAERKTLLVAGAAAGMTATFSAPLASVLLAVELLLFELKPRSLVPVALAAATAMLLRHFLLGPGPLFTVPTHAAFVGGPGLAGCALVGLLAGVLSALMTASVYASEDLFKRLPFHWMWWPAVGGIFVGIGGYIYPRALGVGYDSIGALLSDALPLREILILILVKWSIWAISLGSGTSGGVLAPLLMIGSALGAILSPVLPAEGAGFWSLVAMGAILGGTMRAPLTGMVFAAELTGDWGMLLPLLVACTVAHAFTVLVLRRSILTEKVARRGYHVTREYAIDPLEVLFVRDVMHTKVVVLPAGAAPGDAAKLLEERGPTAPALFPLVDGGGLMTGLVTRRALDGWVRASTNGAGVGIIKGLGDIAEPEPVTAFADEPLRLVVQRMAKSGRTRLPVVERDNPRQLAGIVTLGNLLKARQRHLEEEQRRERTLGIDLLLPWRGAS
jgi:H+/Cl- antiporter ClcA